MTSVNADIDALREFHAALVRFRYSQRDMVDQSDGRTAAVRASLAAKAGRWRSELERRHVELDDCRYRASRPATDESQVDCSGLASAVTETEERLERVNRWQQRVDEQAGAFASTASGLRHMLDSDLPRAEAHLLALIGNLEAARGVQAAGS